MIAHPDPKAATKSLALTQGSQGKVLRTRYQIIRLFQNQPSLSTISIESSQGRFHHTRQKGKLRLSKVRGHA